MKPEDPHLLIRCARSLTVLPVKTGGNHSVKDILLKALEMSKKDPTVIRAIKKSLDVYKKIVRSLVEQIAHGAVAINNSSCDFFFVEQKTDGSRERRFDSYRSGSR